MSLGVGGGGGGAWKEEFDHAISRLPLPFVSLFVNSFLKSDIEQMKIEEQ